MSSTSRITLGLIQVAFGSLLLGDSFWSTGALADWKKEWEKTLAAAKKEGQVVLLMRRYEGVFAEFRKEYPEIKVVTITGRGSDLGNRIVAERRAGKFLVDIYVGGPYTVAASLMPAKAVDPISDVLFLPEVVDESKWITGKHRYTDPERKYNFAFVANPGATQISYNTNLVDPKKFDSYRDLLDPKWKGKIVSLDPTQSYIGATTQFMYYHPQLGPEFMKQFFGGMDMIFARDNRQMTDWLAAGKFAICVGCLNVARARKQGLPVDDFVTTDWKEGSGISAGGGTISLMNQAPHPNAAKLLINWFLSSKGQLALQKIADEGEHHNSGRMDIPKDDVDADHKLVAGKKYWDQNQADWSDVKPIVQLGKEIMRSRN